MAAKYKICPFCSHKIKTTTTFCIHCGKDLRSIEFIESNNALIAKNNIKEESVDSTTEPLSENIIVNENNIKFEEPVAPPTSENENLSLNIDSENIAANTTVTQITTEPVIENIPLVLENENITVQERKNPFKAFDKNINTEQKNADNCMPKVENTHKDEIISGIEQNVNNTDISTTLSKATPKAFTLEIPAPVTHSLSNNKPIVENKPTILEENAPNLTNKEVLDEEPTETLDTQIKDEFEPKTEGLEAILEESIPDDIPDEVIEPMSTEKTHFSVEHTDKPVFEKEPEPETDATEEPEDIFFLNEETIREEPYDARKDGYYEDVEAEVEEEIKRTMSDSTKKTILAVTLSVLSVIIYAYWKGYI